MGDREWLDVTKYFLSAIKGLKLGELMKKESFTLFEAMTAIEMMDPKMDTGMISNKIERKILNLEQSVRCGKVKINNLNDDEIIGIIDDTYACLVTWLEGHSIAQTVMTNLYLHEPDRIGDKYLRVFSYAMLKITDILKDIVVAKYCFEEEDFHPSNYGFNLATNISDAKVITYLKEICDHIEHRLSDVENVTNFTSNSDSKNKKISPTPLRPRPSQTNHKLKSPKQQKHPHSKSIVANANSENTSFIINGQLPEHDRNYQTGAELNESGVRQDTLGALSTRFKFTKHLYHSLMIIRKDLINSPNSGNTYDQQNHNTSKILGLAFKKNMPNVINICDNIERNLIQCQNLIKPWKDTVILGIRPVKVLSEGVIPHTQSNGIMDDNLNEAKRTGEVNKEGEKKGDRLNNFHSPGVKDEIFDQPTEAHQNPDYPTIMGFEPLINQRLMPMAYPKCPSINSREKSLDYLNNLVIRLAYCCQSSRIVSYNDIVKFMNYFSKYFKPSSCVVSRSFLQLIYIPNRDLISLQEVLRQSIRDLFNPAILQPKSTILAAKPKLKEKVDSFFADCAVTFSRNLLIYGHNRARQRDKLIDHLESLKMLQYKAILIDEMIGAGNDSNYFGYWIGYYLINDSIQFLLSGLELELYSAYEYDYIFWYLYELLYEKQVEILGVAKKCIEEKDMLSEIHDKPGAKNKNGIKFKPSKNKKRAISQIHREFALSEALKSLSGGIFSLVSGLKSQSKIRIPKSDYTSEETVFVNRFKYLLGSNVAKTFYDQYIFAAVTIIENEDMNPYSNALGFFVKAKSLFESIPEADDEITAYLKVAKTNLIVARLLSSNPDVSNKIPEFDFSAHPNFPIVKII